MGHQHAHHGHHHHHHHHGAAGGEGRLLLSIGLNLVITIAEVVGGLLSGSLALLSDALHNLSDTTSLAISYAARRIARREPTRSKTFGYRRAEIIGAFINLVTLLLIALYLMKEAVERFLDPQPVDGPVMLVVAVIGLAANLLTALLLFRFSKGNLNIRSAFLHILSDGISSLGVVFGGLLILWYDVTFVDPLLTLLISVYLLFHSYHMLRETIDILMEGTPAGMDLEALIAEVRGLDRVVDVHHLHVWQLDEQHRALEAHVVIDKDDLERMEEIKRAVKTHLAAHHEIAHSTLEFEFVPCQPEPDADCYEHHA